MHLRLIQYQMSHSVNIIALFKLSAISIYNRFVTLVLTIGDMWIRTLDIRIWRAWWERSRVQKQTLWWGGGGVLKGQAAALVMSRSILNLFSAAIWPRQCLWIPRYWSVKSYGWGPNERGRRSMTWTWCTFMISYRPPAITGYWNTGTSGGVSRERSPAGGVEMRRSLSDWWWPNKISASFVTHWGEGLAVFYDGGLPWWRSPWPSQP